jgi:hypothetical protein
MVLIVVTFAVHGPLIKLLTEVLMFIFQVVAQPVSSPDSKGDQTCAEYNIEHRQIKPYTPQTEHLKRTDNMVNSRLQVLG